MLRDANRTGSIRILVIMSSEDNLPRKGRMKTSLLSCSLCAAALLLIDSSISVSAAETVSFMYLYNSATGSYVSLQNIATAHNGFVRHHQATCSTAQQHKWWVYKLPKDLATVTELQTHLSRATAAQRKKPAFHDLKLSFHDIKNWGLTAISPRLTDCKIMAVESSQVDLDISNVANDLHLGRY